MTKNPLGLIKATMEFKFANGEVRQIVLSEIKSFQYGAEFEQAPPQEGDTFVRNALTDNLIITVVGKRKRDD